MIWGAFWGRLDFLRVSQKPLLPYSVPVGGWPGKGSKDVQLQRADGTRGLPARASPTEDRLSLMKIEKPFPAHSPLLTSKP